MRARMTMRSAVMFAGMVVAASCAATALPPTIQVDAPCESFKECPPGHFCRGGWLVREIAGSTVLGPVGLHERDGKPHTGFCEPIQALHQPCTDQYGCQEGLSCNRGFDPAQCESSGGEGAICGDGDDCQAELVCRPGADGKRCLRPGDVAAPCESSPECSKGLVCRTHPAGRTCSAPGEEGESCGKDDECRSGLLCYRWGYPRICLPLGRAGIGDPCGDEEGGASLEGIREGDARECAAGLLCSGHTNPPRCVSPGGADAPCAHDEHCQPGFVCGPPYVSPELRSCRPAVPEGQECFNDEDCAQGLSCNFGVKPRACLPPQGLDGPCLDPRDCQEGLVCNRGIARCRPPRHASLDELCSEDVDCAESLVCRGGDWPRKCLPPGSAGDLCRDDHQCGRGMVCLGKPHDRIPATRMCGCGHDPNQYRCGPRGTEGARCWYNTDCGEGLQCSGITDPRTCIRRGGEGSPCQSADDCQGKLVCYHDTDEPRCASAGRLPDGAPCEDDSECQSELVCHYYERRCLPPGPEGTACLTNECLSGLECMFSPGEDVNRCRALGHPGDPCLHDWDCVDGLYCADETRECSVPASGADPRL